MQETVTCTYMYTFRWGCQQYEAVKCYTDTAQKHRDGLELLKAVKS